MTEPIIRIEGLGKRYRLNQRQGGQGYRALRDVLAGGGKALLRGLRRGSRPGGEEFWALKDVSFEVARGEVVGVIGRNGAGKSTLLKVLSRITEPTTGRVTLDGRVASLLEVGTGFHPELTGRENVYLNGSILGMRRAEIARKFDEIVAFAEVEKFLDTPVKRYSSGMYVRLAFAVAAHLEPEILIVDEVLAVGDAAFQKKCLGKMGEVAKGGRTVLFVSHNMSVLQALCGRAVLLEGGRVRLSGGIADVVSDYLTTGAAGSEFERPAGPGVRIVAGRVRESAQADTLVVEITVQSDRTIRVATDVLLADAAGSAVGYGSAGAFAPAAMTDLRPGVSSLVATADLRDLAVGSYAVSLHLTVPDVEYLDRADQCLQFDHHAPARPGRVKRMEQRWEKGSFEFGVTTHVADHRPGTRGEGF